MTVIYVGEKFYWESGTIMSSIYEARGDGYVRTDWGLIQSALQTGKAVRIRPATKGEVAYFEDLLDKMKSKRAP